MGVRAFQMSTTDLVAIESVLESLLELNLQRADLRKGYVRTLGLV